MNGTLAALFSTLVALIAFAGEPGGASLSYRIDREGSFLKWDLPATLHTVHGTVPEFSGAVETERGAAGQWTVRGRVVVRAAAMKTGNESRDRTMREKVLETDKFPEIVFEVSRVDADLSKLAAGEAFNAQVSGNLTVHGKTQPVDVRVKVEPSAGSVLVSGVFDLRWKSYGLQDPSFAFVTVREPMKVTFQLRAVPATEHLDAASRL